MTTRDSNDQASRIAALLGQTAEAHREYEIQALGGENDDNWPEWYAQYLRQNGLGDLLDGMPGRERVVDALEENLRRADESFLAGGGGENWPAYYAEFILNLASA